VRHSETIEIRHVNASAPPKASSRRCATFSLLFPCIGVSSFAWAQRREYNALENQASHSWFTPGSKSEGYLRIHLRHHPFPGWDSIQHVVKKA
jgi:hypothetical protein